MAQSDEDDDRTLAIKRVLRKLPAHEQILFILYTEVESYRQLAKLFGVSRTTILNKVKEIKDKIRRQIK
jgi:DNA-directed RNA polymerase specialized sigma24 family protein